MGRPLASNVHEAMVFPLIPPCLSGAREAFSAGLPSKNVSPASWWGSPSEAMDQPGTGSSQLLLHVDRKWAPDDVRGRYRERRDCEHHETKIIRITRLAAIVGLGVSFAQDPSQLRGRRRSGGVCPRTWLRTVKTLLHRAGIMQRIQAASSSQAARYTTVIWACSMMNTVPTLFRPGVVP